MNHKLQLQVYLGATELLNVTVGVAPFMFVFM